MFKGLQDNLINQYLNNANPEELLQMLDSALPSLLNRLTAQEKVNFLKELLQNHLGTILRGLTTEERGKLLTVLLPTLIKEFPLDKIDWLSLAS
ncbi:MAG: hypothetical protein U9Q70_06630 [Chloroflexota bacterium]|nr:hypothetical protein [Chloroflexota bacterium]